MYLHRRRLLKIGLGSAALLTIAGGGVALVRPGIDAGRLTTAAENIFRAIAAAVLDGSLAIAPSARESQLRTHLRHIEEAIAAFPAATQAELSQLLALLASAPGRSFLARLHTPWDAATPQETQACLQSMRTSSIKLRQQAYHALRDLTNAAFYADPQAWPLMGYPGPVPVS